MIDMIIKEKKELPSIFSALSESFFPSMIPALGALPIATKAANALIAIMTGIVTPTPVNACEPMSGICPIYARSTML